MTCRTAYPGSGVLFEATCIDGHGEAKNPSYAAFQVRFYGAASPITLVASHATGDATGYVQVHYELPDDTPLGIADVVFVAEGTEFSTREVSTLLVKALPFTVTEPDTHTVYWGVGATGIDTPATIEAMGGHSINGLEPFSFTVSPSAQKVYWAVPEGTTTTVTSNGFAVSELATRSMTLHDGTTAKPYTLHETNNLLTWTNLRFDVVQS